MHFYQLSVAKCWGIPWDLNHDLPYYTYIVGMYKKPSCHWGTAWCGRASWSLVSCYMIRRPDRRTLLITVGLYHSASAAPSWSSTMVDEHKFAAVVRLSQRFVLWQKLPTLPHPTCIWDHPTPWGDLIGILWRFLASENCAICMALLVWSYL